MTSLIDQATLTQAKAFAEKVYRENLLAGPEEGLREHSLATAIIAACMIPEAYVTKLARITSSTPRAVKSVLMLAGLMHDWGKALAPYQEYLIGKHAHAPIRHEVTSFITLTSLTEPREGAEPLYTALTGAVLYHHHGLYYFTEKIVKYLHGGVRAWPSTRGRYGEDVKAALEALIKGLSNYLARTPTGETLRLRQDVEDVIKGLTSPEDPLKTVLANAVRWEERVNQGRHVVTPSLTALMIGDNVSAGVARGREGEEERILRMSMASAPAMAIREARLSRVLRQAGLTHYAEGLRKAYEALLR